VTDENVERSEQAETAEGNECTAVYKTFEATCHYDVRLTDIGSDNFSRVQSHL